MGSHRSDAQCAVWKRWRVWRLTSWRGVTSAVPEMLSWEWISWGLWLDFVGPVHLWTHQALGEHLGCLVGNMALVGRDLEE